MLPIELIIFHFEGKTLQCTKELTKLKENNPILKSKNTEQLNIEFSYLSNYIYMAKRQINMCPTSSVIRKMKVKITMKCHYMSIRMAKKN